MGNENQEKQEDVKETESKVIAGPHIFKSEEPKPPEDSEKPENPDDMPICGNCSFWLMVMQNAQMKLAMGTCVNKDAEEAPYGVVLSHFASCDCFAKKQKQSVVKIPKKLFNRFGGKL